MADEYPRLQDIGGDVNSLVAPLVAVWRKYWSASVLDLKVVGLLELLTEVQAVLDDPNEEFVLSADWSEGLLSHVSPFLQAWIWLGDKSDSTGLCFDHRRPETSVCVCTCRTDLASCILAARPASLMNIWFSTCSESRRGPWPAQRRTVYHQK